MMQISIIIPSYNCAEFLRNAIDSIRLSNFKSYEIIIIDDGSTDDTKHIIEPLINDNRIRYFYQKNKGLSGARNTGIKQALGKFLVFLDADDIILPDKLQKQSNFLNENPDIDIVYSKSQWFVENNINETIPVIFPVYSGFILHHLLYGNFIHVNSIMVRKHKVEEAGMFDESFKELEDWDLWLRMSVCGSKFGYLPEILSKVRIRKGSMTMDQQKMNLAMIRVLFKTIQTLNKTYSKGDSILVNAHHALFLYKLKAKQREDFLSQLFTTLSTQGITFAPFALKLFLKYFLGPIKKQDLTTLEVEKVWKKI